MNAQGVTERRIGEVCYLGGKGGWWIAAAYHLNGLMAMQKTNQ